MLLLLITSGVTARNAFRVLMVVSLAASSPMLVAPTGYDVEVKLPIRDMVEKYSKQDNSFTVINNRVIIYLGVALVLAVEFASHLDGQFYVYHAGFGSGVYAGSSIIQDKVDIIID